MILQVLSSPKTRCVDSAFHFLRSAFNVNVTDIPIRHKDDFRINVLIKLILLTDIIFFNLIIDWTIRH